VGCPVLNAFFAFRVGKHKLPRQTPHALIQKVFYLRQIETAGALKNPEGFRSQGRALRRYFRTGTVCACCSWLACIRRASTGAPNATASRIAVDARSLR
jgi:hypothetical protein